MELDKRIKALTDIQSVTNGCHDYELMNKKGYFADHIAEFKDLSKCMYGEFVEYREHEQCFLCEIDHYDGTFDHTYYRYFIPEDSLLPEEKPEKKYRPYTLDEFVNKFSLGDEIILRQKENGKIFHKIFMEFEENVNDVRVGSIWYSFQMLFVNYELYTSEGWQPFGVMEDD